MEKKCYITCQTSAKNQWLFWTESIRISLITSNGFLKNSFLYSLNAFNLIAKKFGLNLSDIEIYIRYESVLN